MEYDVLCRVKELLAAQKALLTEWAESDPGQRASLLENLHYEADRLRDEIDEPY